MQPEDPNRPVVDQASPITPDASLPTTSKDAEAVRAEERAIMGKLLDDMETTVDTQGQYFVPLGQKKPISAFMPVTKPGGFMGLGSKTTEEQQTVAHVDNRAYILKAPITRDSNGSEYKQFFVVTPDGIFKTKFFFTREVNPPDTSHNPHPSKSEYDTFIALTTGKEFSLDEFAGYNKPKEYHTYHNPMVRFTDHYGSQLSKPDPDTFNADFQEAVKKSIEMTESPYKKQVAEAKQQIQVATAAANMIRSLPPRE